MPVNDNKRIAKNTLFLYIRQFITMAVSLFTFRMVLKLLGVDDYGTYNVIAGLVILFSFISGAMTQSTQRYMSFHIGKNDMEGLKRVFTMSINMYMMVCGAIFVLAESIGLWFVNTYLEFPHGDMVAVNIVYQCTILTLIFQILQLPYRAAIISFERMNFFAYLSVLEVVLKLLVVLVLFLLSTNRLIGYALSLLGVAVLISAWYRIYCIRKFEECKYIRYWNKDTFKELISFGGWNLLGSGSNVAAQQGLNILFNIFVGVGVNAAMGVSNQVCNAVNTFVTNFQTAFNPQIIKLYAAGERQAFFNLIFRASRISFMLLFVLGLPIIVCCKPILNLWLTEIPEYTLQFIQLMLVFSLIDALSGPLWISAQATGNIKGYMILISGMIFLNLPFAYVLLKFNFSPVCVILVRVILNFIIANIRVFYLKGLIGLPVKAYYYKVMIPILGACAVSAPLPLYLRTITTNLAEDGALLVFTFVITLTSSSMLLLTRNERTAIFDKLKKILHIA